tara:strand:- start:10251 stop:10706 length:456 start_codon:yes stop_codon:yes gene_type:complete
MADVNFLTRARQWGDKVYLAGLGAYSKAGEGSEELYEKYLRSGTEAYGESAEGKPALLLAGRGLVDSTVVSARKLIEEAPRKRHELYERCVDTGKQVRGEDADTSNELLLAGTGAVATVRERGRRLFDELLAAGEQASAGKPGNAEQQTDA